LAPAQLDVSEQLCFEITQDGRHGMSSILRIIPLAYLSLNRIHTPPRPVNAGWQSSRLERLAGAAMDVELIVVGAVGQGMQAHDADSQRL
jgi:hypothetical protein